VLFGEPQEQGVESCPLFVAQGGEELVFELAGEAAEAFERLASPGCHPDELASSVVGVASALDEAGVFELVEEPHQLALVVAEGVGDCPLGRQ
jgi:hypothetical protein